MPENMNARWYALRVKSQRENVVAKHLQARGFEFFLPLYASRRRWSDRFQQIEVALFPGYVFCRFDALNRLPILTVPGIVHVVGVGKVPMAVDDGEIAAIQAAVRAGLPREPWPFLRAGDRVRIERGPLFGIEGILLGFKGHHRLVLSVTLLQRSVAVQIEEDWVRQLPTERLPSTELIPS